MAFRKDISLLLRKQPQNGKGETEIDLCYFLNKVRNLVLETLNKVLH